MSPMTRPGYDVVIGQSTDQRAPLPHPSTLFFVGTSLRGGVARGFGIGNLRGVLDVRQNWSGLHDEAFSAIAESASSSTSPWALSRVTGPAAVSASVTLNDSATHPSIKVKAKEKGAWPNGGTAVITTPSTGKRRLVVTVGGEALATSPAFGTLSDLAEWSDDDVLFTVEILGTQLPANTSGALAGGDDDRANITLSSWQAAFDALPRKFGPGLLFVDSTDPDVLTAARAHGAELNRVPFVKADLGASVADLIDTQDVLRADDPSHQQIGGLFAGHAWTRPIPSEPARRVSTAAVQMGNQSRVLRDFYVAKTAFGASNAPVNTITKLTQEFSDEERATLYANGINVMVDDGATIATYGYCTAALEGVDQDLHNQIVRMCLKWECEEPIAAADGQYITPQLFASTTASLKTTCDRFVGVGALVDYRIDLDTLNTPQTAAGRSFYANLEILHTGTVDWAQMTIYPNAADANLA